MDPLAQLVGVDNCLISLVERLNPGHLTATTPCSAWDVRGMLSHTLQSIEAFSAASTAAPVPTRPKSSAAATCWEPTRWR